MSSNISRFIVIAALVAFAGLVFSSTASAVPSCPPGSKATANQSGLTFCANTSAQKGGTEPPIVEQTFELPDMLTTGGKTAAAPFEPMQYIDPATKGVVEGTHRHDDAASGKTARQMVVKPNVDDKPNGRQIEIWALVSSPVGAGDITAVHATVRFPNGAIKVPSFKLTQRACADLGLPTDQQSAIHAAIFTGQIANEKPTIDPNGPVTTPGTVADKLHRCGKGTLRVYSGIFKLSKNQPEGKYSVDVQATGTAGGLGQIHTERFTVLNVLAFKMDFTAVAWGAIVPGAEKTVPGDDIYLFGDTRPTVQNTGNSDMCLSVTFQTMRGKLPNNTDVITQFKAKFLKLVPLDFSTAVGTMTNPRQFPNKLAPNVPSQISFTVVPPAVLATDTYQGRVDLSIKKAVAPTQLAGPCPGARQ